MTHPDDIFAQLFPPALPPLSEDMKRRASALMLMREAVAAPEFARALMLVHTNRDSIDVGTAVDRLTSVLEILDAMADEFAGDMQKQQVPHA